MSKPYINQKWPGLLVKGEKVTSDQAAEIIVRTCEWPISSNKTKVDEIFNNLIASPKEFKKGLSYVKPLKLNYLHNQRITSCWIGGPHGWINWDGTVFANNYNIGKWPSINEVTEDWITIAENFPFLNLRSQVLDCEAITSDGKKLPIIATAEWIIKDGKVDLICPEKLLCEVKELDDESIYSIISLGTKREIGASVSDVKKGIELAKCQK